jgi:hypothetical protein
MHVPIEALRGGARRKTRNRPNMCPGAGHDDLIMLPALVAALAGRKEEGTLWGACSPLVLPNLGTLGPHVNVIDFHMLITNTDNA